MSQPDLQLTLHLMNRRIEPAAQTLVAAVRIEAPHVPITRRPLDLVACVDVSGSMAGQKIERMRSALEKLVDQLGANDRLGIVAFEGRVHDILAVTRMTPEGKASAHQQIKRLEPMGMTAMGGGLRAGYELLAKDRRPEALRRVLLFTDGHANVGLHAGDLAGFRALIEESAQGASASFFGYGEDHDGPFLSELADLAGGNYHYAVDADAILDTFARELGGLLSVVATDVEVKVRPSAGVGEPVFLNDFRVVGAGGTQTLHLPDVYAEERKWIVFELPFGLPALPLPAKRPVAEVEVIWRTPAGGREQLAMTAEVELVDKGLTDEADLQVKEQRVILRAAQAQKQAAQHTDRGEFEQASFLVHLAAAEVGDLGTVLGDSIGMTLHSVADSFGDETSYRESRSSLAGLRKGMGRGRAAGSSVDALYETGAQAGMRKKFQEPKKK